ncbi:hypothetical protein A1Q1_07304 [Trichosporon asahii var. asahii CBS 2479]|uniref:Uncharacterized protein n=1 Tax=Trichosporon asahii var. asahii (strain ATCC 90039 / CBS 2479 / JCM 2466 / KCTC 7840 / NBRC 103889/ NCYC 2677 / UAMH 7654) TaxID=1186058 RepID=J6F890_TRIAS|nr:hypothetical protein A1Q1_07304 [Trichosporon asahii var. asahii CBS 2479]EJT51542.1 hypothetical protein A1Q1_07304 [Trichosporon asahii var. asahii CBS 2479]
MSSPENSPSKSPGKLATSSNPADSPDHRWPTGHNARPQRVAGQVFPSLGHSTNKNSNSMTETLERLRTLSLESKAMSDSLASEVMPLEESPTGGKSSPYGASEHDDWMARWQRETSTYCTIPNTPDVKSSPTPRYKPLSEDFFTSRTSVTNLRPTPKLQQKTDPALNSSDTNGLHVDSSPSASNVQRLRPHESLPAAGFFMTPWSAPLLQRGYSEGRFPTQHAQGVAAFPPSYGSLPNAPPYVSPPHPGLSPSSLPSFVDSSETKDVYHGSFKAPESEPEKRCSECAGLRHELEFIRLQLAAQQSSLNRIVTEIAAIKSRSVPRPLAVQPSTESHRPPPPWRNPHSATWICGPPPPPPAHPSSMQPPPYPFYYGPYSSPIAPVTAGSKGEHYQANLSRSATELPSLKPDSSPHGAATLSPVTRRQPQQTSERKPSPKRVSFACPMTQSEPDSDGSSEETLVSKVETQLRRKPSNSNTLSKKTSALKKASSSSSVRPKPYPITGSLKHRPTVYSSVSPRSYYGVVQENTKQATSSVRGRQEAEPPTETSSPLQPNPHLPFVVPFEEGGESNSEDLHVRFDATTLFNFMQFWQPRADGPEPLLVDLSLDASTYQDFVGWGRENGSLDL